MMTGTLRSASAATVALAAVVLVLAGCTAEPSPAPMPSSPSVLPPDQPDGTDRAEAEFALPDVAAGELSRAVFTLDGPGGVPETTSEVLDIAVEGTEYTVEARCTSVTTGAWLSFIVETADDDRLEILRSEGACDDGPWRTVMELTSGTPLQITVTSSDGVEEGYARIVPNAELERD